MYAMKDEIDHFEETFSKNIQIFLPLGHIRIRYNYSGYWFDLSKKSRIHYTWIWIQTQAFDDQKLKKIISKKIKIFEMKKIYIWYGHFCIPFHNTYWSQPSNLTVQHAFVDHATFTWPFFDTHINENFIIYRMIVF